MQKKLNSKSNNIFKDLASNKLETREQAINQLQFWFQNTEINQLEMLKLWKALFYNFWLSDKTEFQVKLMNKIISLTKFIQEEHLMLFLEAFLITMQREWKGIDFYRLDKYYLFMRKIIAHFLSFLLSKNFSQTWIQKFDLVLFNTIFSPNKDDLSKGVTLHIISIFVEELRKNCFDISIENLCSILQSFWKLITETNDFTIIQYVQRNIFQKIISIDAANILETNNQEKEKEKQNEKQNSLFKSTEDLKFFLTNLSESLLKLASSREIAQENRNQLYSFRQKVLLIKSQIWPDEILPNEIKSNLKKRKEPNFSQIDIQKLLEETSKNFDNTKQFNKVQPKKLRKKIRKKKNEKKPKNRKNRKIKKKTNKFN
ncbi:RIBOSOMAL RNA-PROCESSING 1 [Anaeramoeba ignava]|uniref:RIBOSOMAL RNA-PROCESSING 1 n=1 Tax=Anaeramoeba ignava TaxID=1746090 RepID=A0A9Q0LR89_ANAIG|nr:RIBOSOMAL RNA-PROCESSING 1 [Anaeramoeba ignava]